ncbi:MAG: hypothetical protein JWO12_1093 [Frankiales bacterium]|nr:hypothetical protein [Frankiales bacterium]
MRRCLLVLLLLVLAVPGTARADDVGEVAAALQNAHAYQTPGVDLLDVSTLNSRLAGSDPPVVVAALPAAAASSKEQASQRAVQIRQALGNDAAVVLVVTANQHLGADAGPAAAARGVDARAALDAELAQTRGGFTRAAVTAFAESFAQRVADQASSGGSSVPGGSGEVSRAPAGNDHSGAYLLGGLLAVGGGALALRSRRSRRRREAEVRDLRADVVQLYDRLGNDVLNLDGRSDPTAQQALSDASDRYNAAGSALASARTAAELAAARRSALEGLHAARTARQALGLPLGPDLPALQANGPLLDGEQTIQVGDQSYEGSPHYQPGRGHYFGGGYVGGGMVPGGWYSAPFWTPFLLGSVLSGGFGGGGLFGGGYGYGGDGFERGYDEGYENGSDSGGGGDWGGGGDLGGGGDWGGGGDMGGGGDW